MYMNIYEYEYDLPQVQGSVGRCPHEYEYEYDLPHDVHSIIDMENHTHVFYLHGFPTTGRGCCSGAMRSNYTIDG